MNAINLQALVRAVGGEVKGNKATVRGPNHSAADRSLSVELRPDAPDGFLVHSFSGDDPIACRDYVRTNAGLPAFQPRASKPRPVDVSVDAMVAAMAQAPVTAEPRGRIVATYDYGDEYGELMYQVLRYEPKDFRQRRPDGNGGWIWSLLDRRVPYRWQDLKKYPDATVFVCEGEKDANRLADLGHTATTVAAGTWTKDCVRALAGRDCIVLEDNDEPGRKKAVAAAQVLQDTTKSIRIVRLPDLAEGGDVSDWIDHDGGRAAKLVDLCLAAPMWEPVEGETAAADQTTGQDEPAKRQPISATPYICREPSTIPLRQYLYGRNLIRKFVSVVIGQTGLGKSTLSAAETLAQVTAKNLLGVYAPEPLLVWLWNLEDPQEETERKLAAAMLHYGLTAEDIGDRLFVDSGRDQPLVIAEMTRNGAMIVRPVVDGLVSELIRLKIDIIKIDPFVSSHTVPENDNGAMDMIVKEWGRVADRANCAVELYHHPRKTNGAEVTAEDGRGGSSMVSGTRVKRPLNRMTQAEGDQAGVTNHRLYFRILPDTSLAPPLDKSDWYKLVSVDLGNGPHGAPGDSVGVVTKWEWPDHLAGITAADFDKVAAVIRGDKWRQHPKAGKWVGNAIAQALGMNVTNKGDKARISAMLKCWLGAGSLIEVETKDETRRTRKFIEVKEED